MGELQFCLLACVAPERRLPMAELANEVNEERGGHGAVVGHRPSTSSPIVGGPLAAPLCQDASLPLASSSSSSSSLSTDSDSDLDVPNCGPGLCPRLTLPDTIVCCQPINNIINVICIGDPTCEPIFGKQLAWVEHADVTSFKVFPLTYPAHVCEWVSCKVNCNNKFQKIFNIAITIGSFRNTCHETSSTFFYFCCLDGCWSEWSQFGPCGNCTAGEGTQTRIRTCIPPGMWEHTDHIIHHKSKLFCFTCLKFSLVGLENYHAYITVWIPVNGGQPDCCPDEYLVTVTENGLQTQTDTEPCQCRASKTV